MTNSTVVLVWTALAPWAYVWLAELWYWIRRLWFSLERGHSPTAPRVHTRDVESARLTTSAHATVATTVRFSLPRGVRTHATRCGLFHSTAANSRSRRGSAVLDPCELVLQPGCLCGILGPSGAGKTTLLNVLNQRSALTSTVQAAWGDVPITKAWLRRHATFIGTDLGLPSVWTVLETFTYYGLVTSNLDLDTLLGELKLASCRHQPLQQLSTGQRKRVHIGLAMLRDSRLVCLDEPTSGLSDSDALDIIQRCVSLRSTHRLVLMVLHQPRHDILRLLDHLVVLRDGKLVWSSSVDELESHFHTIGTACPHPLLLPTHLADNWHLLDPIVADVTLPSDPAWNTRPRPQTPPPLPTASLRLLYFWWLWDCRSWLTFVCHGGILILCNVLLSNMFAANLYGIGLTRRAQLLFTSFPLHLFFLVAFQRRRSWAAASQLKRDVYLHIGRPLHLWFANGWAAWLYQLLITTIYILNMRRLDGWRTSPSEAAQHCALSFLGLRCTVVFRDLVTLAAVHLHLERDVPIYAGCFLHLLLEASNGLFVDADDMNPLFRPLVLINPLYAANTAILALELDADHPDATQPPWLFIGSILALLHGTWIALLSVKNT